MKCKCNSEIPQARVALGYRVCVSCSQEQAVIDHAKQVCPR